MRINQFLARATGLSRRSADAAIVAGRVTVDGHMASPGQKVNDNDTVRLDGQPVVASQAATTLILHKPVGYVVSRQGQGSRTIYDLLPAEFHSLKPVGRLDKDSSGLLLMTNDGQLAQQLTHPSFAKVKLYEIELDNNLSPQARMQIEQGVQLEDGLSHLQLQALGDGRHWQVSMTEGRNRQIRRTFEALGYRVRVLHRTQFGPYALGDLKSGEVRAAS